MLHTDVAGSVFGALDSAPLNFQGMHELGAVSAKSQKSRLASALQLSANFF